MTARFDPAMLDRLDEPVRRYFLHALAPGGALATGTRLSMIGRIDVGVWLPFRAVWEGDARSFWWSATSGPFGLALLRVVDRFAAGSGSTDIRLRGGLKLLHAEDADTTRSGAGRAAAEAMWTPASLLPARGVRWHGESDELIVATWDVPPERPELRFWIDDRGAVRAAAVNRWTTAGTAGTATSPAAARCSPTAASATSRSPAASASAGGTARRATSRSSRRPSPPPSRPSARPPPSGSPRADR